MKHFLITRFNVKFKEWNSTDKKGVDVLDQSWLDNRLVLFEKYCLPSIKNQSYRDFVWCLFFDKDTSKRYIDKVKKACSSIPQAKLFFVKDIDDVLFQVKAFINISLQGNEWFVSTRLDNDDLVHKDFLLTIQQLAIKDQQCVIDLRRGFQLCLTPDKAEIRKYKTYFNPFISLVENKREFETVISRRHVDWREEQNLIVDNKHSLWIELVHDRNFINDVSKISPIVLYPHLTGFPLSELVINKSFINLISKNTVVVVYKLIFFLKRLIKKLILR